MDGKQQNGSIASTFQFINYKIDKIDFRLQPMTNNLVAQKAAVSTEFGIAIRNTLKTQDTSGKTVYIAGLAAKVVLKNNDEPLAEGEFSISGVFTTEHAFSEKTEQTLAKQQAPTILFPYLRAAITNILASSGFDTVMLPLINVAAVAKDARVELLNLN